MITQITETETRRYYKNYLHHAHAVGITWALLTCCFLIINIIVFAEDQWIGDTYETPGAGWVGLYTVCELVNSGREEICEGHFQNFNSILMGSFKAATFFIGVSVLLIFLCILLFVLFLFIAEIYVYIICGVIQVISTIFMFLGCVIFPGGWDHIYVKRICGDNARGYHLGDCDMRWAYILAIIGVFDIMILAILAFVLAFRQADKWTKYEAIDSKSNPGAGYVVDVASSHAGSTIVPHQSSIVRGPNVHSQYGPPQPLYVVDDGHRAPSEMSTGRSRRARTPYGSEARAMEGDPGGSVYRGQSRDSF